MTGFSPEEKRRFKYYALVMGITLAGVLVFSLCSCSSMSVAKQKKAATLIGQQIEFIGDGVIEKCSDGTISEDNCVFMAEVINQSLNAQNAYTRALIAMQNGTGSAEQVQKALEAVQEDVAQLISSAISLGIKTRKETK